MGWPCVLLLKTADVQSESYSMVSLAAMQPRALQATFPGVPDCNCNFGVLQRTLRDESAADTLADIAAGRTTRWLLPWLPLMQSGAEIGTIDQWKVVAQTEADPQARSTLGGFALLFADLAARSDPWKRALEG